MNLIQTRINSTYQPVSQPAPKRTFPEFDLQKEVAKKELVKPLPATGKLVNGNILNSPVIMAKNFVYDIKAFKHAVKGEANDHELGRLNNVGLVAGGLGIAGYLFSRRQIPTEKGMEFIGLGSFLASMALWPKIAIQLPAYLIHGVNVQKQYEDSFGRRKPFYQDPQFIPWDLYSDKEINKIGNRLGVDKNLPNRRDFIQEKMRKLAVQNNTLWMLTAGFATPIMSSLISAELQPYLLKFVNNKRNKEADNILKEFNSYTENHQYSDTIKNLEKLFLKNKDAQIDENLRNQIIEVFTDGLDTHSANSFRSDFNSLYSGSTFKLDENSAKALKENLYERFKHQNFDEDLLKALFKDENRISGILDGYKDKVLGETLDIEDIKRGIIEEIRKNYKEYYNANPNAPKEDWKLIKTIILNNNEAEHPIRLALKKVPSIQFNETMFSELKTIAGDFDKFITKSEALNKYAGLKVASAPETVAANYWNGLSKDLLKIFGFSEEEIKKGRIDENLFGRLLREKIETIASNKTSYDKVVSDIITKLEKLDELIKPEDITSRMLSGNNGPTAYEQKVDEVFDAFSTSLKNSKFEKTARAIAGASTTDSIGSAKNIQKSFVEERVLGIKSSFYRLLNTLDMYRRIATDANSIKGLDGQYREMKEELLELCKQITLEGHSSDFANKFFMLRNPNPNQEVSDVVVENGKVINKFFGKAQMADVPNDYYFFQKGMTAMFDADIHPDTQALLENKTIKNEVLNYRRLVYNCVGGSHNFAKQRHKTIATNTASDIKFLLTGISPKEFFFNNIQNTFNTKKWLKMFGGAGAALLGVTVLSQFFFGRIKQPRQVKND